MWTTMSSSRRISESAMGSTGTVGELMPLPDPLAQRTRSRSDTEIDAGAVGERSMAGAALCQCFFVNYIAGGDGPPAAAGRGPAGAPEPPLGGGCAPPPA